MADGRRVGQAQRRRIGASSNVYDTVLDAPSFGLGDKVRAGGRYGEQTVTGIHPGHFGPPDTILGQHFDGHGYEVSGGKKGRKTVHSNTQLKQSGEIA